MIEFYFHYTRVRCGCNFVFSWNSARQEMDFERPSKLVGTTCVCERSHISFLVDCYKEMLEMNRAHRILVPTMVMHMQDYIERNETPLSIINEEQDHE